MVRNIISLRGGGACSSLPKQQNASISANIAQSQLQKLKTKQQPSVDYDESKFVKELQTSIDILKQQSSERLLNPENKSKQALQFIFLNEHILQQMITDKKKVSYIIDLIDKSIHDLLVTTKGLIKQDTLIICQFLYVISLFLRISFTFQLFNDQRVLQEDTQKQWLTDLELIEQEIKIEKISGCYKNQIDYELFVIGSVIQILQTNSQEGTLILKDLFSGVIQAVMDFPSISINDQIKDALGRAILYLVQKKIKSDILDNYRVIYAIESYKWKFYTQIVQQILKGVLSFDDAINQVVILFQQLNVQKTWQTLQCWIRMIEFIITNQGRIILNPKNEYPKDLLNKNIIFNDKNIAYLKIEKTILLAKQNQQLIKQHFKGFDDFPIFYKGLIMGESILPQLDQYKTATILSKFSKQETNPMRLFIKQTFQDFKIEFNRIKQFDLNTRFIKFQNQCLIKTNMNSLTLEQINKFYEPKLSQLEKIIEIMHIQLYFFYHSFIFYSENLDHEKKDPVLCQFKSQKKELTSKIDEITQSLNEIIKLKLSLSVLIHYTEFNQKYNRYFSDMTYIKNKIIDFEKALKDKKLPQLYQLAEKHLNNLKQLKIDLNYFTQYEEVLNLLKLESIMIPVEEWLKQRQSIINFLIGEQNKINNSSEEYKIMELVLSQDICSSLQQFCKIVNACKDFNNQKDKILRDPQFKAQKENQKKKTTKPKIIEVKTDQLIQAYQLMKQNIADKKIQQDCIELHDLYILYQSKSREIDNKYMDEAKSMIKDFMENQEFIDKDVFLKKMESLIDLIIEMLEDSKEQIYLKKVEYKCEPFVMRIIQDRIFNKSNEQQVFDMNQYIQVRKKQELRQFYVLNSYDKVIDLLRNEKQKQRQMKFRKLQQIQQQKGLEIIEIVEEVFYIESPKHFFCHIIQQELDAAIHYSREFGFLSQSLLVNSDGRDRLQLLCLQVYQTIKQETTKYDQELDLSFLQNAQQIYNQMFNDDWRIRQCILRSLLTINMYCWNSDIQQQIDYQILKFKVFETDKKVNQILIDKEYQNSLSEMYTKTWISQQEKIQDQIKQEIQNLNQLQTQIQNCSDVKQRQQLLSDYHTNQIKIQEQLKNIEDIGAIMGIQIIFLQDLKLDLIRLETKLDQIRENINNIQIDIQYLRGKNIYQMLEIRQNRILYQKQQLDAKNIYISLYVKEFNYKNNKENERTLLYTEQIVSDGEINEFIWGTNEIKTTLLIHGLAGCGKSTSARKVEEFLWQFNQTQKQLQSMIIPIIPIVISLPSLQDPAHLALEHTLKSDSYNFDDKQILELKQEIDNEKIRLLIILDSYDELKPQFQINLIDSNKFNKWGCEKDEDNYPKIIITSRTEVLDQTKMYSKFVSDEQKLKYFKEIRLINFDETQIKNYIQAYCKLQAKQIMLEQYKEFLKQSQQQYEMQNLFYTLWDQVQFQFDNNNLYLMDEEQAEKIILAYKREKMELTQEKQKNLIIQLMEVWSPVQYLKYIEALNLQQILITAFMMEIVIQVLPQMIAEQNNINNIGDKFKIKYKELTQATDQDIEQIWEQLLNNQIFIKKVNISLSQQELEQIIESSSQDKLQQQKISLICQTILFQNLTKYDFYQKFYEIYIRKQLGKVINESFNYNEEICYTETLKFATDLAIKLSNQNQTIISYVPQGYMYKRKYMWQDDFFDDTIDEKLGYIKKIYRKCIPIKQKFNSYQFNHKSLQEFLVARDLYELVQEIKINTNQLDSNGDQYVQLLRDHNVNQNYWNTDFMKGTIEFIVLKLQSDSNLAVKIRQVNFYNIARSFNFVKAFLPHRKIYPLYYLNCKTELRDWSIIILQFQIKIQ